MTDADFLALICAGVVLLVGLLSFGVDWYIGWKGRRNIHRKNWR